MGRLKPTLPALLAWACLTAGALFVPSPNWAVVAFATGSLLSLPGLLLCVIVGVRPAANYILGLVAVALSATLMMLVGVSASALGPHMGVERPFDRAPQLVIWLSVLGALFVLAEVMARKRRATDPLVGVVTNRWVAKLLLAVVSFALPVLALLGAARLNAGNGSTLAVCVSVAALVVLALSVIVAWTRFELPVGAWLFSVVLTVAWGETARGYHVFGWDIQKEFAVASHTIANGLWSVPNPPDAYQAMLSLTALPAQLHSLTGLSVEGFLRLLAPVCLALAAVGVYVSARRFASRGASLAATVLLMVCARTFALQLPAIIRQEIALMLFVALVALVVDSTISTNKRRVLAVGIIAGISVSHYTTAYVLAAMVVAVWLFSFIIDRMTRRSRKTVLFSLPVVVVSLALIFGWNALINDSNSSLDQPTQAVSSQGVQLLDNPEGQSFVQAWLSGNGIRVVPIEVYRERLDQTLQKPSLDWLQPDPTAADVPLDQGQPARISGPLQDSKSLFDAASLAAFQFAVLISSVGGLYLVVRYLRRDGRVSGELAGFAVAALVVAATLRLSNTAATFFNPERGAVVVAAITALGAAMFFDRVAGIKKLGRMGRPLVAVVALGASLLMVTTTWGLGTLVFGGSPPAALSKTGEDYDRFAVSSAELGSAGWMRDNLPPTALVQTDRYGQLALLNVRFDSQWGLVPLMAPEAVHQYAWVYASRANTIGGNARGLEGRDFGIWEYPSYFDTTRGVVYSTEETRVYR